MKTWTDSLALKLLSNFFELYSKCFELHNDAACVTSATAVGRWREGARSRGGRCRLAGVSRLVTGRWFERDRRCPNVTGGRALLGVDRDALGAGDRLLGRARQLRLAADDAAVVGPAAATVAVTAGTTHAAAAAAAARRHAGVVQLVLVVERLQ